MAPRTTYANLQDGLQNLSLWDASLADMGKLGITPCTAAGTNAIILTPIATAFAPTVSSPPQQLQQFSFVATATSSGSVTVNGLKLYKEDGTTQAAANDVLINVLYGVVYNSALNGAAGGYQIAFPITSIINPVISGATISGSTITTSTYNGNTWTAGTGILTIAALKTLTALNTITVAGTDGKTASFSNSLTFAGTDGTTLTFQGTDTYVGRATTDTLTNKTINGANNTLTVLPANINSGTNASSGTFLRGDGAWTSIPGQAVDTIAALKALSKLIYSRVVVNGYYTAGDCRPRTYWYDSSDTTSSDNGGSIIVASDGGRWKLIDKTIWTVKFFGATENPGDGDMASIVNTAISAAATAGVPLEWDGNFRVSMLTITGLSGMQWIGRGGLIGIAGTAKDAILQLINCTDLSVDGRFVVNGNYNTNYTYGLHGFTNGAGQSLQYLNLNNVIFNACPIAWAFGSTGRPDDTVSEINFFGGRTYGCPGIGIGIGKNTVVNTHGCTWQSEFGTSPGGWGALANTGIEAKGATININGGELLYVLNTTGALTKITGLTSGTGNTYGNINIKDCVIECANLLSATDAAAVTSPSGGSILISSNRMVFTTDVLNGTIQYETTFPGRITVVGNSGFSTAARTQWNINGTTNTTAIVTTDMQSFGLNCLQGYNGLNGGAQQIVVDGDCAAWTAYTPTVTAQSGTITTIGSKTGRYLRRGKTILVQVDVQITTNGTAAQGCIVTLPFTAAANNYIGSSYEYGSTGKSGAATIGAGNGATAMVLRDSTGTTYFASGAKFSGQVEYELP